MIQINRKIFDCLLDTNLFGYWNEDFGGGIDGKEFILYQKNDDTFFLSHESEYEIRGFLFRLKNR